MADRLTIVSKKALCWVLCLILAIGEFVVPAYAYGEDTTILDAIAEEGSDDESSFNYAFTSDETENTDGGDEGTDPGEPQPTDPDPEDPDPVTPTGPLTFTFDIKSSPKILDIEQISSGLMLTWTPVNNVDGYLVLRRKEGAGAAVDQKYLDGLSKNSITLKSSLFKKSSLAKVAWACYTATSSPNTISWTDKKASYGQVYEYCVIAYKKNPATPNSSVGLPYIPGYAEGRDLSLPSGSILGCRIKTPTLTSVNKKSKTMTVKWNQVAKADGYIVQCSKNSAFTSRISKTVKGSSSPSVTFTGLSKSSRYCVRIKAYSKMSSETQYSSWDTCSYTTSTKRASMSRLMYKYKVKKKVKVKSSPKKAVKGASTKNLKAAKKTKTKITYVTKKKPFELRARAGQKMGKYDTMQGGCSDGKYMYLCLLSKAKKRCKIVKVSLKTKRAVKVSKPLKLNHGNGLAYNPDTKRIVVAHGEGNRKAITEISKSSLKKVATHYVFAPSSLRGATAGQLKEYNGFGSIAYSAKKGLYACLLHGSHNVVLLDKNFNMVRYITLTKKMGQIYQSIEVAGDSILIGESFGSTYARRYNILSTYDWDGKYVTTTRLQQSFELENIFMAGNKVYAGFYRSYVKGKKFTKDNYVYCLNTF